MYRWELDGPADQEFADLNLAVQALLAAFMDAVVIGDPVQYQRRRDERDDVSMPLRTLHFGPQINEADIVHAPDACTCFVLPGPASDRGHLARDGRRRLF
jgi:hypothetical protein